MAKLETKMQGRSAKMNKVKKGMEKHYNLLLDFTIGFHSATGQPMFSEGSTKENGNEEVIVQ